jgi:hypothetical protein
MAGKLTTQTAQEHPGRSAKFTCVLRVTAPAPLEGIPTGKAANCIGDVVDLDRTLHVLEKINIRRISVFVVAHATLYLVLCCLGKVRKRQFDVCFRTLGVGCKRREAAGPFIRIGIIIIHGENAGNVIMIATAAAGEILLTGLKAVRCAAAADHTGALDAVNCRRLSST